MIGCLNLRGKAQHSDIFSIIFFYCCDFLIRNYLDKIVVLSLNLKQYFNCGHYSVNYGDSSIANWENLKNILC